MIIGNYNNILHDVVQIMDNNSVVYWSQPDFSYKHRIHLYNVDNKEIGYVQYKVTSEQKDNYVFSCDDSVIDVSSYSYSKDDEGCINILLNNNKIANLKFVDDSIDISFNNNDAIDIMMLYIYSILN